MYSACLFCQRDLGRNAALEHFPVGRRLAYDPAKGRLWVVCHRCERWCLSPLEERWGAIDEAERLFRVTRLRVSTPHIGLARVRDGLELVRIGQPQRPELAAWRYGDQFGRRRRREALLNGAMGVAAGALVFGGKVAGVMTGGLGFVASYGPQLAIQYWDRRRVAVRVALADGSLLSLARAHVRRTRLLSSDESPAGWALSVAHLGPGDGLRWDATRGLRHAMPERELTGDVALRAAARILPHLNAFGGATRTVREAVDILQATPEPRLVFRQATTMQRAPRHRRGADPRLLAWLPPAMRLALEMAAHEDAERRAMEGELALLDAAWREAEEIAAIADDLLVAPPVGETAARPRGGESVEQGARPD